MLSLANVGADVLRLDAVAFCWKRLGTTCESQPEAHLVVRALNALARIAAPGLLFNSEAIAHPAEVASYIDRQECQLAYNPVMMALGWETLATRNCQLLRQAMRHWFGLPSGTTWVNYVRSHDDIGWTFDDEDAAALGINAYDHRRFLNSFYTGRFEGSFARGLPFQENQRTGDARVSGTAASLAGLEKALREEGPAEVDLAIGRLLLLYGIAFTLGGIPVIYLGDEIATLNDYSYRDDPAHAGDSRWVHRPKLDGARLGERRDRSSVPGKVFAGMKRMIKARKRLRALAGSQTELIDTGNDHIFAFRRDGFGQTLLVFMNFTEQPQAIYLSTPGAPQWIDELTSDVIASDAELTLQPYRQLWLSPRGAGHR
jgi:amylosucrase